MCIKSCIDETRMNKMNTPKQWLRKEKEKMHFINSKTKKKWTIENKGGKNEVFANIKNTNMSSVNPF